MSGNRRQGADDRASTGSSSGKAAPGRTRAKRKPAFHRTAGRGRRSGNAWVLFWVMAGTIVLLVLLS